jgi:hypothetical protein
LAEAVNVYQLRNTLISSTSAPPAEIHTDLETTEKSMLEADGVDGRGGAGGSPPGSPPPC